MNQKTAMDKIAKDGVGGSRIESRGDKCIIEVKIGGVWTPILRNLTLTEAESIMKQATNRTICG